MAGYSGGSGSAKGKKLTTPQKKAVILEYVQRGLTQKKAADDLGLHYKAIAYYKKSDEDFRRALERALVNNMDDSIVGGSKKTVPDFPEFCRDYLDTHLFNHQLQWFDMLEGRPPRNLHPAQHYEEGDPAWLIINTPPEHSKSTTVTINYTTWRICQDPNIRIIIVSQRQELARQFLRAIKDRLAGQNPAYKKLQAAFAPGEGFDENSAGWSADSIYVNSEARDSGEPTPTCQALGIGGQIYGNRADLIILDDTITGKNAHEFHKQIDWIQREVLNRVSYPHGRVLLVGTRLAPVELYSEIRKPEWYGDGKSPWTYLSQPAVLEYADDPRDWVVLAPWSNRPSVTLAGRQAQLPNEEGLYPWHTGKALASKRNVMSAQNWAMVYQQEQVVEDATFPTAKVMGCVQGNRSSGPMSPGGPSHRPNGMSGLYIIGGFDPALTGHSAAVVMGLDRNTGERWVLDVWTRGNLVPDDLFNKIKEWTMKYSIMEWSIEKNAMNLMVTQNRDLRTFLNSRGCRMHEHFTGTNKNDRDFGVASMSTLFDGHEEGQNLIHLPSRSGSEGTRALVEQLVTWFPQSKGRQDTVMALWFAETRAREMVNEGTQIFHVDNIYRSPRDNEKQVTVDLDALGMATWDGSQRGWWS